jgi:hypothetical protein
VSFRQPLAWIAFWVLALAARPALATQVPDSRRPNIVVFVADDLG